MIHMNLADDLKILREVKTAYKHEIIRFVAHLYTHHADAMSTIDGQALVDIIYSEKPLKELT